MTQLVQRLDTPRLGDVLTMHNHIGRDDYSFRITEILPNTRDYIEYELTMFTIQPLSSPEIRHTEYDMYTFHGLYIQIPYRKYKRIRTRLRKREERRHGTN